MKKYFVIGNPIKHSLSPLLHNHWIRKNNIIAEYEKKRIRHREFGKFCKSLAGIVKIGLLV